MPPKGYRTWVEYRQAAVQRLEDKLAEIRADQEKENETKPPMPSIKPKIAPPRRVAKTLRHSPRLIMSKLRGKGLNMSNIVAQIKNARRVSTPLACIRTADPAGTMAAVKNDRYIYHPNGKEAGFAGILVWDIAKGLEAWDRDGDEKKPGEKAIKTVLGKNDQSLTNNLTECLIMLQKAPPGTIVFIQNAHRYMDSPSVTQALWNLRDPFKSDMRMLILLCPTISLPAELQQDVLMIDEPLPLDSELKEIAVKLYKEVDIKPLPDEEALEKIVDATLGLAVFPAEQAMAMSLEKDGINVVSLWERKRSVIDSTPGLSVWRGGEKFEDLGGLENIKSFLKAVMAGKNSPRTVVFIDEIEKAIGTGQDTSGVSQGMLGQLLTWMQDNTATGMLLVGPPGAAKSALAKATGNEANIPTIALDLGGMKASLVGESEARFRNALRVIDAVSQKRALFIATCNSLAILPPELKRRFTFGTYYVDLPTAEERKKIWDIYRKKYELPKNYKTPEDTDWTGAEVKQAADLSWRLGKSLVDVADYIVPVAKADAERIHKLRTQADGKFISASYPGMYKYEQAQAASVGTGRRALQLPGEEN